RLGCQKACVLPENPASYRVVRTKSYLFNKALQKLDSDKDFAPNKVVFYGSNFESAKQMELNEALKSYANKKSIDLDLVVRN
ncbi:hypothetical protein V9Z82_16265, partial [Klebsiella pneumoniae]|uniref:hypothetical protein n=1 Tax=Klebsiella pneumoniae TaxID=573 RepID=UPI00312F6398